MSDRQLVDDVVEPDVAGPTPDAPHTVDDGIVRTPPAETEPQSNGAEPDLNELLRQYDESTNPAPALEPEAAPVESAPDDLEQVLAAYDREQVLANADATLRTENEQLRVENQRILAAIKYQRDMAEFDRVGEELSRQLQAEFPYQAVAPAVIGKLYQLAMTEPALGQIFDHRDQNPRVYQRALDHVRKLLYKELSNVPDPDATADRAAVIWAVRGGQSATHVPEPPTDYGQLDNQQMREEIKKLGFDPGF